MEKIVAACILLAAQAYSLPPAVLMGVYQVESGKVGFETGPNKNGSYDLGPMQINTIWMKEISTLLEISPEKAKELVRDDPCMNVEVAAWILNESFNDTGDLSKAIARYHSRTPGIGDAYKRKVIIAMKKHGLL